MGTQRKKDLQVCRGAVISKEGLQLMVKPQICDAKLGLGYTVGAGTYNKSFT